MGAAPEHNKGKGMTTVEETKELEDVWGGQGSLGGEFAELMGGKVELNVLFSASGCEGVDVVDVIGGSFQVVASDAIPPVASGVWVCELCFADALDKILRVVETGKGLVILCSQLGHHVSVEPGVAIIFGTLEQFVQEFRNASGSMSAGETE